VYVHDQEPYPQPLFDTLDNMLSDISDGISLPYATTDYQATFEFLNQYKRYSSK
jgi:hypothetical protein